ncbi:hypothetical protein HI914_03314 [Erysiphe necator]|nr:hypothetical protein HI914_03314 [Erysiphe necator]
MKASIIFSFFLLFGRMTALPTDIDSLISRDLEASKILVGSEKIVARATAEDTSDDVENELAGECRSVTMLFAKGTGETGNLGSGKSPGPALAAELRKSLGRDKIAVQGVDYKANVLGFLIGGDLKGSKELIDLTNEAATKCPDSELVLSGYSQGAQVVHKAVEELPSEVLPKIKAVVLFGDPFLGDEVGDLPESSVLSICNDKDTICHSGLGIKGHLKYPERAKEAADFIVSKLDAKNP